MTSPTIERPQEQSDQTTKIKFKLSTPLILRRCAAWGIEISLVSASALIPYGLGAYANNYTVGNRVPLSPVLATTEEVITKVLALPNQPTSRVPPLTNLLWWGALVNPLAYGGYQIYLLGKTGQTAPKKWLGVRVINSQGNHPGIQTALVREGVGRWGTTLGSAYLLWRFLGAFPDLGILIGLTGLAFIFESTNYWFDQRRLTIHDRIGKTDVVEAPISPPQLLKPQSTKLNAETTPVAQKVSFSNTQVTSIVKATKKVTKNPIHLWRWMIQHPGATLLAVGAVIMASILGTFVATQVYIQNQANRRDAVQQRNNAFLSLVQQLSTTSSNTLEERRSAILALARLDDPRVAPLLVDLLGQERHPSLIDTIQQALVSTGPGALPPLRHLNQALGNDFLALQKAPDYDVERKLFVLRLRASQRAIAKLIALHNGRLPNVDLSRTNLSFIDKEVAHFQLVWNHVNLSGINFRGSVMSNSSLKGSTFYSAGADGRLGTFDDWITDLSGADLHDANLSNANLNHASVNNTNLIRANLNGANLSEAMMKRANLSSASLVNANLSQAVLVNASLTGAKLGQAKFFLTNLQGANLGQVNAPGADFSSANLSNSSWQGANLAEANLQNTNLRKADLSSSTLVGTNLRNAQLQNANLRGANLSKTDLRGANLTGADFQGVAFVKAPSPKSEQILQAQSTSVTSAKINGVNFAKVKNLGKEQLEFICSNRGLHPDCQ